MVQFSILLFQKHWYFFIFLIYNVFFSYVRNRVYKSNILYNQWFTTTVCFRNKVTFLFCFFLILLLNFSLVFFRNCLNTFSLQPQNKLNISLVILSSWCFQYSYFIQINAYSFFFFLSHLSHDNVANISIIFQILKYFCVLLEKKCMSSASCLIFNERVFLFFVISKSFLVRSCLILQGRF